MSDNLTVQECIAKLVKQSTPNVHDDVHQVTVEGANRFMKHFGTEQMRIVGSTGEKLKLTSAKDAGDVDLFLISGKLAIPVECIECRRDTPCFLWIKGNHLKSDFNVELIDGKYLPAQILRDICPELFTFGRGIFNLYTSAADYIRGNKKKYTVLQFGSKVGLSITEYCGLRFVTEIPDELNELLNILKKERSLEASEELLKRRKDAHFNWTDMDCFLKNGCGVSSLFDAPYTDITSSNYTGITGSNYTGITGSNEGQFHHLITAFNLGEQRLREEDDASMMAIEGAGSRQSDLNVSIHDQLDNTNSISAKETDNDLPKGSTLDLVKHELVKMPEYVVATCESKGSKDFVPALRIVGKLTYMDAWKKRKRQWPDKDIVDKIYEMDVYVVSKYSPMDHDPQKDFCLSFNEAEQKLSEIMTTEQRYVLLIMKSYLRGVIENEHKALDRKLRLKTFHIKTALYWVIEEQCATLWTNVIEAVKTVLMYLTEALQKKELLHYFVPSNLFAGFDDDDFQLQLKSIVEIQADPLGRIRDFFALDESEHVEIKFKKEEVRDYLMNIPFADDASQQYANTAADALVDFQRGFNGGIRDSNGNVPIKEAIIDFVIPFIDHQRKLSSLQTCRGSNQEATQLIDSRSEQCVAALKTYILCQESNNEEKNRLRKNLYSVCRTFFPSRL